MEKERARSPLSSRQGHCRPFASFNGSPGSFERVGRFATIGCSGKDGKSAQGNGAVCRSGTTMPACIDQDPALFEDTGSLHARARIYSTLKFKA